MPDSKFSARPLIRRLHAFERLTAMIALVMVGGILAALVWVEVTR